LGAALKSSNPDAATEALQRVTNSGKKLSPLVNFIRPYSWILLGEIAMEKKDFKNAQKYFSKSKEFEKFDWEKLVQIRIYINQQTLDSLKEKEKEKEKNIAK